jgi:parallel beta-helix repeat protein
VSDVREHSGGIVLDGCARVNLTGCSAVRCDNAGIVLKNCSMCRVSDCLIQARQDALALQMTSGGNNMVVDNLVSGRVDIESGAAIVRGTVTAE